MTAYSSVKAWWFLVVIDADGRMGVAFLSTRSGQFTYFAIQLAESNWHGKDVLDFGGNIGNILLDPNSTIDHERYWCIDVVRESIEKGRAAYPEAHWIFYDRYCFFFNPNGVAYLPFPDLEKRFDYIVAYSVFTNTSRTDMLQLVDRLKDLLVIDGALAFTFIDPHYVSWPGEYDGDNFRWRVERERGKAPTAETQKLLERARNARWCMFVNGHDLYIETEEIRPYATDQQESCHVFYTSEYMQELFPEATILTPANGEMQHCCVIRK